MFSFLFLTAIFLQLIQLFKSSPVALEIVQMFHLIENSFEAFVNLSFNSSTRKENKCYVQKMTTRNHS